MFLLETINSKTLNAGLRNHLRSGSSVKFIVKSKIGVDFYRISINGKILNVKSYKPLKAGDQIHARVSFLGNRLQLKVSETRDLQSSLLQRAGIPDNPIIQLTAEALLRSGMPFSPVYFEQIKSALQKRSIQDIRVIRLLLLMIDKGIPLDEINISEMENLVNYYEGYEGKNDKERKHARGSESDKDDKTIIKDLEVQIKRRDTGTELLKFFNHRIADHDNWIIIPLEYSFIRKGMGILKLKLDRNWKLSEMMLSLNDGTVWEFNLLKNGDMGKMRINGPECREPKFYDAFSNLCKKLYNKGIQTDDINSETLLSDGFTEISQKQLNGVDFMI